MTKNSDGIFYGWFIIAVSIVGICFAHSGIVNFGFSSFILPLQEEFGLSRGEISFAFTAAMLAYTIGTPFVGGLLDNYGVRRILLTGLIVFIFLVFSMYFLTASLWHLYGMYILLGLVGSTISMISYARLSITWFDKRKGLALALSATGAGIAGIIVPPLIRWIIDLSGWREAYVVLGGINLLISLPLIYWIIYDTPEEKGTYPDGVPPESETPVSMTLYGYTFRECLRSLRFWKIGVIFALFAATHAGPISQLVPLLEDSGFTQKAAAYAASLLGVSLIIARLICGYLLDKFFAPYVALAFLITPVFGLTALALDPGIWSGIFATITLGLAMGAEFDVMPYFCVQYFGRYAFGKAYGIILVMFAFAAAPAAVLTGMSYDIFSSYKIALLTGVVLSLIGAGLMLTIGKYPDLPKQEVTS